MTALGKLLRATAFRLALAILALSAVGAGIVLSVIAWQVVSVVDEEMAQTIEAEAKGLADQYAQGGVRRLGAVIEARTRQPGSSLYLLTDAAGEPLAGNVQQIPPIVLEHPGLRRYALSHHWRQRPRAAGAGENLRAAWRFSAADRP